MTSGIEIGGLDHRIALYADDVILFLKILEKSIPTILDLISNFGSISGYKINKSKSSIMFLNSVERGNPPKYTCHFKNVNKFTYLGIYNY